MTHAPSPGRPGAPSPGLTPVKFSRLTRRGVVLGLSTSQLIVVGIATGTLVVGLYAGGGTAVAISSPVLLMAAGLAWVSAGGRKLVEWLPIVARWCRRSASGQLLYRRRVMKPRPAGTLALPG